MGPLLEVVVPARNEGRRLPEGLRILCDGLAGLPMPAGVVVVDNGSTDNTAEIAQSWGDPVRVLKFPQKGKGAAVRAGILATTAPYVGFCDADMATDLGALGATLTLLTRPHPGEPPPVVIGSRAHPMSAVEARHSPVRRVGAWAFRALTRQIVPGVGDTQCGFKFFEGDLARRAAELTTTAGFAFDVELLAWCRRLGAPIREIPVDWRDVPDSTFSVARHSAGIFTDIARIWWTQRTARTPVAQPVESRSAA